MVALKLVYGPDPIFSMVAEEVKDFDQDLENLCRNMIDSLYHHHAVGIGANMVGVLKRIIVIDLQEHGVKNPQIFINPEIINKTDEVQIHQEASVCFPGISADIERAKKLTLAYQTVTGEKQTLVAEGYLATVIQHEQDYLNGKTYLDYLSAVKRKMLIKKSKKYQKQNGLI